jgi:ABC-2 type transport system ATP-binding protein
LDEPTTGVDPVSRRDFWRILQNLLQGGMTIVMTTPYLDEAERCTRVGLMNHGELMGADTPEAIKKMMPGQVVEIVCDRVREGFHLIKQRGLVRDVQAFGDRLNVILDSAKNDIGHVEHLLQTAGIRISSWRVIPPSLENVFIYLLSQKQTNEVHS